MPTRFDPRDFGAVGDGSNRTVQTWLDSGLYPDLATARIKTGIQDLATTHIADGAAWQAAINAAVRVGGGIVGSGPGKFRCDDRTLYLPYRYIYPNENQPTVNIEGDGRYATRLEWQSNTAPAGGASAGIAYRVPTVGTYVTWAAAGSTFEQMSASYIKNMNIRGPGDYTGSWPVGTTYPTFDGIEMPDRVNMYECHLSGWRHGLRMKGGQRLMESVAISDCYDAIYLDERHPDHHGDMTLVRCWLSGKRSCIAIHHTAAFFGNLIGCFTGGSPFFMIKEAGNGTQSYGGTSPHEGILCAGCVFEGGQFEAIGNAIFQDLNPTRRLGMRDISIINQTYIFNSGQDVTTDATNFPRLALFDVGGWERVRILNVSDPDRWGPKTDAMLKCNTIIDSEINSADGFLTAAAAVSKPLVHANASSWCRELRLRGRGWDGRCHPVEGSGGAQVPINKGHAVGLRFGSVHKMSAATEGFVGVAMADAAASGVVPVAENGSASVRTDGAITGQGGLVKLSATAGVVTNTSVQSDSLGAVSDVFNGATPPVATLQIRRD